MNLYTFFVIAGVAVIGMMAILFGTDIIKMSIGVQDYDIYVDPLIDKQNLFVSARIIIQNTGAKPLTNVLVNFGDVDSIQLGTLSPQHKVIVSPPPNNPMEFVLVQADQNITVLKSYREPPKMVGMMGS
jgi:hypothetical protein